MRDGNACEHGLCDDESYCRYCRVFGYGNWPELPERLKNFIERLDAICRLPTRTLTHDEIVVLRSSIAEAREELMRRRDAEERQARA
jgi:hypothetical protein